MHPLITHLPAILALAADPTVTEMSEPHIHTYSIVAYHEPTQELGIAVQSKYFAVGAVVPWARARVGAIATQALARVSFGPDGLRHLADGKSPQEALQTLLAADKRPQLRQVAIIDAKGNTATHTGAECIEWAGHHQGHHYSVQGNLLTGPEVIQDMAKAFEKARDAAQGELADWLLAAMTAAQTAGGDRRGQQSAALLIVREGGGPGGDNDRAIDLRIDDHPTPIQELHRLLDLHKAFHNRKPR